MVYNKQLTDCTHSALCTAFLYRVMFSAFGWLGCFESHLVLVPDVYKASEIRSESGITIQLYKAVVRLWKMVHIEATRYETQKVPTMT